MIKQESGGNPYAVNLGDIKHTGEPSIGCLQYQPKTWVEQIKKYNLLPNAEENEYMNYINDCELQQRLTWLILKNEKEGWKRWGTSFVLLNLPKTPNDI